MTLLGLVLAAQVTLAPCLLPNVAEPVRCGSYDVWENRETRSGRKIALNIIVLPATSPSRQPDPLFLLQGGPGQGVTGSASFYNRAFSGVRRTHDLVLVNLRGTGKSAPLTCPELAKPDSSGVLDAELLSPDAVNACRDRLERQADLRQYTTDIAVDDLDEVRQALGYEHVNLYGTSSSSPSSARRRPRRHRRGSRPGGGRSKSMAPSTSR